MHLQQAGIQAQNNTIQYNTQIMCHRNLDNDIWKLAKQKSQITFSDLGTHTLGLCPKHQIVQICVHIWIAFELKHN